MGVGIFANRFIHNVGNYMVGERASGAWLNTSTYIGTLTAIPEYFEIRYSRKVRVTAGMIAAFMSTHDSYFLCWSSVIVRDVVGPLRREAMSDKAQIRLTRVIILAIGVFLLVCGLWGIGADESAGRDTK